MIYIFERSRREALAFYGITIGGSVMAFSLAQLAIPDSSLVAWLIGLLVTIILHLIGWQLFGPFAYTILFNEVTFTLIVADGPTLSFDQKSFHWEEIGARTLRVFDNHIIITLRKTPKFCEFLQENFPNSKGIKES